MLRLGGTLRLLSGRLSGDFYRRAAMAAFAASSLALAAPFGHLFGASLSVEPITWNVVGLDSNNVNSGPCNFPVGVRVTYTGTGGDPATAAVTCEFDWDTSDSYINFRSGTSDTITQTINKGSSKDFYFEIGVARDPRAYDHARRYHVHAATTGGVFSPELSATTPTPREIYVERLVSQNRNEITDVKLDGTSIPPGGTMTLVVGKTYTIVLDGKTATGYNQLEAFINFPNTVFQVLSVNTTYSLIASTYATSPSDKLYADACLWENDPTSLNYRSCVGSDGKAGGTVVTTFTVRIIGGAGTSDPLTTLLYDCSGSSYHYNADYAVGSRIANVVDPATSVSVAKSFSPNPIVAGGVSTMTITLTNASSVPLTGISFTDTFPTTPGNMTVASTPSASTTGLGATALLTAVSGAGTISLSGAMLAANSSGVVKVNVTADTASATPYSNSTSNVLVGGVDSGNHADGTLTVSSASAPPSDVCGITLAQWTFLGYTTNFPAPNSNAPDVIVNPADPKCTKISVGSLTAQPDNTTGLAVQPSILLYGWPSSGPINTSTYPYLEFAVDTTNYFDVEMTFNAIRKNPGPDSCAVYYSFTKSSWASINTFAPSKTTWGPHGPFKVTGTSSTGLTYFRIYGYGANSTSSGSDINFDDVTFKGCTTPKPPNLSKSFATDPVKVGGTSLLTFTITNPNTNAVSLSPLTSIAFSDSLPSGLTVATNEISTCNGGTLKTTSPSTVEFSGGSLAPNASCSFDVTVTCTTGGPHLNTSGAVTAKYGATDMKNSTSTGFGSDPLTAVLPPTIDCQFAPNPVLAGGTSTLTFIITNPNPDNAISGVGFGGASYDLPSGLTVASLTSSTCGGTNNLVTTAPRTITLSGGEIGAGSSCTFTVTVTTTAAGSYAYSTGPVSHVVGVTTVNGNTASDTLTVTRPNPSLALTKLVGPSASGPWKRYMTVAPSTQVYYKFIVENTGDVPLTGIQIVDPNFSTFASCNWLPTFTLGTTLETCSTSCVEAGPSPTALVGDYPNTAIAKGSYGGVTYSSAPSTSGYIVATAGQFTLLKQVSTSPDGPWATSITDVPPSSNLYYKFTVINGLSVGLTGVHINDPNVITTGYTFTDPLVNGGASFIVVGPVTSSGAAGKVTNTATASGLNGSTNYDSGASSADYTVVKDSVKTFGHLPGTYTGMNALADGGAFHKITGDLATTSTPHLGGKALATVEITDPAYVFARRDTDDGVFLTSSTPWTNGAKGGSVTVVVTCPTSPCDDIYVNGWIDWNNNNTFADSGDRVITNLKLAAGTHTVTFNIPDTAVLTGTQTYYSRFRLYSAYPGADPLPNGAAMNSASTAGTSGEVEDYKFIVNGGTPTPVTVSHFSASRRGGVVSFAWSTSTETGSVGFNIYVRKGGKLVQVNGDLIPSRSSDSLSRRDYVFEAAADGDEFFVENVGVLGEARLHGPFRVGETYGWADRAPAREK